MARNRTKYNNVFASTRREKHDTEDPDTANGLHALSWMRAKPSAGETPRSNAPMGSTSHEICLAQRRPLSESTLPDVYHISRSSGGNRSDIASSASTPPVEGGPLQHLLRALLEGDRAGPGNGYTNTRRRLTSRSAQSLNHSAQHPDHSRQSQPFMLPATPGIMNVTKLYSINY